MAATAAGDAIIVPPTNSRTPTARAARIARTHTPRPPIVVSPVRATRRVAPACRPFPHPCS